MKDIMRELNIRSLLLKMQPMALKAKLQPA